MSDLAFTVLLLTAGSAAAAEYGGAVRASGLPLPGAVVTATQAGQKVTTTTDDSGVFAFADLRDGEWSIEVQSLESLSKEIYLE